MLLRVILSLILIVPTWAQTQAPACNAGGPQWIVERGSIYSARRLGGIRTGLLEKGIVFDFFYISDSRGNPTGGLQQSATTWERVRGTIDIDFSRFMKWLGLQFHATGLWRSEERRVGKEC